MFLRLAWIWGSFRSRACADLVGAELLVLDVDELDGRVGGVLVHGGHGRHLVTDEADLVHGQRRPSGVHGMTPYWIGRSLPVITARTWSASARLVSMETIRRGRGVRSRLA